MFEMIIIGIRNALVKMQAAVDQALLDGSSHRSGPKSCGCGTESACDSSQVDPITSVKQLSGQYYGQNAYVEGYDGM